MKLVHLTITPEGNPYGAIAEIAIDPDPGVFKSCYLALARMGDGSTEITASPATISEARLAEAQAFGERLLNVTLATVTNHTVTNH